MTQSAVSFLPKSIIEVKLNIPPQEIQQYYEKSLSEEVKKVQLPGFRKGRAPRGMVESHVGKEKIYEKAINTMITSEFEKALKEAQEKNNQRIFLLEPPRYNIDEKWKIGESLKVTVNCAIYPKVDISKVMQKIQVKRNQPEETSATDVEAAIDRIFDQYKKIKEKEAEEKEKNILRKRGLQENDVNTKEENKEEEKRIEKDDTFAQAAGAQNMHELKEAIRKEIEEEKARAAERAFEEEVIKEAQKYLEIDIPDILINEELDRIEQRFKQQLKRLGLTFEKYIDEIEKKTEEDIRNEWYQHARENTAIALLLQQIRIENNIEVTQEEVNMFTNNNITKKGAKNQLTATEVNTIAYIVGQVKALNELKKVAQYNAENKK